ncbi:hypothetical protein [Calidithermus terrae]|uniref:hypothetical protein n=1 Tax=Calidithermus terrae TaxID=1408545 RepID=UPI0011C48916|nr:hypothetical protein [Calidithermus terrae]
MNNRLSKLEAHARSSHSAAWGAFWSRFRTALDSVPAGALERFGPIEVDGDLADLEDELRAWESWGNAVLPVLERAEQGDLGTWPGDLPRPPSDPRPLLLELVSRWRRNPRLPLAALLVLLALGSAVGEGVPLRYADGHAET